MEDSLKFVSSSYITVRCKAAVGREVPECHPLPLFQYQCLPLQPVSTPLPLVPSCICLPFCHLPLCCLTPLPPPTHLYLTYAPTPTSSCYLPPTSCLCLPQFLAVPTLLPLADCLPLTFCCSAQLLLQCRQQRSSWPSPAQPARESCALDWAQLERTGTEQKVSEKERGQEEVVPWAGNRLCSLPTQAAQVGLPSAAPPPP